MDISQWAMGMDNSGPVRIENTRAELPSEDELYNTAPKYHFEYVYENGVRMIVTDNSNGETGIKLEGDDGKSIFVTRENIKINSPELRGARIYYTNTKLYKSTNHVDDFISGIYSGQRTAAPIEASHRSISICHLANIGIRLGRDSARLGSEAGASYRRCGRQ